MPQFPDDMLKDVDTGKLPLLGGTDVAKALFGWFLGVISALLFWWLNSSSPHLAISVGEVVTFQGDKTKIGLTSLTVINDGSKMAEQVQCRIEIPGTTVQEVKAGPANLNPAYAKCDGDTAADVTVPHLNPGESLQVSLLVSIPDKLTGATKASIRAKGVIGERTPRNNLVPIAAIVTSLAIVSVPICMGLYGLYRIMMWLKGIAERLKTTVKKD